MKFTVGMLVLINHALARVQSVDSDGFDFHCENGGWHGRFNTRTSTVTIKGDPGSTPAEIVSTTQPPAHVARDGYNAIIPWMLANSGARV